MEKTKQSRRSSELSKDVETGASDEERLYNLAYSGEWTKNYDKQLFQQQMHDQDSTQHNKKHLIQLVALNVAATQSRWDFIAYMLGQMTDQNRRSVLTTNLSDHDLQQVKDGMTKFLRGKNYSETTNRLDGSPEFLLLAVATSGQFRATYMLANSIHIQHPARSGILLYHTVNAGFYDVALLLCERHPQLSVAHIRMDDAWGRRENTQVPVMEGGEKNSKDEDHALRIPVSMSRSTILQVLATRRSAFRSSSRHGGHLVRSFVKWLLNLLLLQNQKKYGILGVMFHFLVPLWIVLEQISTVFKKYREEEQAHQYVERLLDIIKHEIASSDNKDEFEDELRFVIKIAARKGIVEIVKMCLEMFPCLIRERDNDQHILHYAIEFRHEQVFNLIRDELLKNVLQANTWIIFEECKDIMILAAESPSPNTLEYVVGSALQVQREIHWFQEVENVALALNYQKASNNKDQAHSKFVENRKRLVEKGEEWMKSTATSCTVVAALVVTVVYQAAFQIPGGTDESKGGTAKLLVEHKPEFTIFAISDIASLFFSSTSLLMFLGILTSRFSATDFSYTLPNRLILGYAALFVGLAAMMTSYTATVFIVLGTKMKWLKYLTLAGVALPVTLFAAMQLPLFWALVRSTYFGRSIFQHKTKGLSFWGSLLSLYCRTIWAKD